jgi:hypothetical protein
MGSLVLAGATSGSTTITPTDAVTATLTLPNATGTLLSSVSSISGSNITGTQSIPKSTLPTGSVLQVVQGTSTTQATTTSGNWDSTGLTASITPTSSSNKILIFVSGGMEGGAGGSSDQRIGFKIYRGASSIEASAGGKVLYLTPNLYVPINYIALDSPATTSSTTYTLYFKLIYGNTTASFCRDSAEIANIILMEIAA